VSAAENRAERAENRVEGSMEWAWQITMERSAEWGGHGSGSGLNQLLTVTALSDLTFRGLL